MTDMNEITYRIGRWLEKNNIPAEGVRIIMEFPDEAAMRRAEATIKMEIQPMMSYRSSEREFGSVDTMNGLGLTLAQAARKR